MLARHAFAYLLSHGVPALVGFLGIAVYSRMLSPEQYGRYALVLAVSALVNAIVFEWLKVSVLRHYKSSKQSEAFYMTVKAAFIGLMAGTLALAGVMLLVSDWLSPPLLFLALLLCWAQAWYQLNLSLLRAELSPVRYGRVAFARSLLGLILGILFIAAGYGEIGLVIGIVVGLVLPLLPLFWQRWGWHFRQKAMDYTLLRQFAAYGLPLTLTLLLGMVIHQSDRIIISEMIGIEATGMYAVTYDLTEQTIFTLMLIINLAAFPLAVKALEEKGEEAAREQVKANTSLLLAIGIPALCGLVVLREGVAELFLGEAFRETAVLLMPYIAVGALLKGFKLYGVDIMFHLYKQTKLQMVPVAVAAIANVILTIALLPTYGLEGAAFATVVAYGLAIALAWLFINKQMGRLPFPGKDFVKVLCATAIMLLCMWPFLGSAHWGMLILQVGIGGLSYGVACLLLFRKQVQLMYKKVNRKRNQPVIEKRGDGQ
ncbi:oligosaccharide flippase family protein [Shouchella clausii]|uniref:oligosaccharide flippase family protein n=1 Tax=Shouchella clausii TaxID=79880 RepID=UPI002898645F|nr:oligosaccharide flippase family protein [Shouchella clausii]